MKPTVLVITASTCFGLAFQASAQTSTAVPLPASAAKPKEAPKDAPKDTAKEPADTTKANTPAATPTSPTSTQPKTTTPALAPGVEIRTAFDPAPFAVEEMGITMLIPKGAKAESQHGGGALELQINSPDKSWIIRVYSRQFSDLGMTTGELMKQQIELVEQSVSQEGVKSTIVEHNKTAFVASRPAERVYVEVPGKDGKSAIVRGITVFKAQPGRFIFVDVLCDKTRLEEARTTYEDTQTTLSVVDPLESNEKVAGLVKAGAAFLASVSEQELKEIVLAKPERWERLYVPSKDGDDSAAQEVGYKRVQTGFGRRSQFAQDGTGGDSMGFYVQIDSRLRVGGDYADMQGIFFLSADRKEELWTLTSALNTTDPKNGQPTKVVVREIGARNGDSLTVSVTDQRGSAKSIHATIPPEAYISRVEYYLLPQMLVKKKALVDLGFYSYQHEDKRIRLRRDTLSQIDRAGKVYEISTSLRSMGGEKSLTQTSRVRETGELVETKVPDGSVWEPTTVSRLIELWRAKGLPIK